MNQPFYLQEEWIGIITQTAQNICRENYADYTIHESDVIVTLKALHIVLQAIKKTKKERGIGKSRDVGIKRHPMNSSLVEKGD